MSDMWGVLFLSFFRFSLFFSLLTVGLFLLLYHSTIGATLLWLTEWFKWIVLCGQRDWMLCRIWALCQYYRVECGRQTVFPAPTQDNRDWNPSVILWRHHCLETEMNLTLSLPQLINRLSEDWLSSALAWWSQSASFATDLNGSCFDLIQGPLVVDSLECCTFLASPLKFPNSLAKSGLAPSPCPVFTSTTVAPVP